MKKISILFASVLFAQLIWAGNHVIVIKAEPKLPKGSTEIKVDETPTGDVITITPSDETSTITITVKDEYGDVIAENDVPATTDGVYEVTTPENNEGGVVEVSDDAGVVYSNFE